MSKKGIFYILFFVTLGTAFFIIVRPWVSKSGESNTIAGSGPVSYLRPFSFVNQDGKVITEKDVAGKVFVAEYFFTTCKGICPKMNNNMRMVYDKFKDEKDFLILSHTCQPEVDSVPQLKKYADSMGVNTSKWIFLTGRKDSLYNMARLSYTIDDPLNNPKNIDDDFLHTQFWALINKEGKVKKIYDGMKESEVEAMIRQIKKML